MLNNLWGRIQKTITRWNHSQPEETSTTTAGQAPVDPAKLRAIYGRFCYLNVGLNRKERRTLQALRRRQHSLPEKQVRSIKEALARNVPNTPIKVFREVIQLGTHWKRVKYSFVNNPFYIHRSRQGAE